VKKAARVAGGARYIGQNDLRKQQNRGNALRIREPKEGIPDTGEPLPEAWLPVLQAFLYLLKHERFLLGALKASLRYFLCLTQQGGVAQTTACLKQKIYATEITTTNVIGRRNVVVEGALKSVYDIGCDIGFILRPG